MSPEAASGWAIGGSAIVVLLLALACLAGLFILFRTGRFVWFFASLAAICGVGITLFIGRALLEEITHRDYWGPPALRELDPLDSQDGFIGSIEHVGDLDHDGIGDLATLVSIGIEDSVSTELLVFSGSSGQPILRTELGTSRGSCRTGLANAGDVDGDGTPDIVVGCQQWPGPLDVAAGGIQILSGRDGAQLSTWSGPPEDEMFSAALAGLGDVDGDRFGDVIVGSSIERSGVVRVYSGRNGSLLDTLHGDASEVGFGNDLCALGDVDGDDHGDFAVGSGTYEMPGHVRAFSGGTRSPIWSIPLPGNDTGIGYLQALRRVGDEDGDGLDDLLIGGSRSSHIVSGRSGTTLRSFEETTALALLPDWDDDGRPEVLRFSSPLETRFYDHLIWSQLDVVGSRGGAVLVSVELPSPPLFDASRRVAGFGPASGAFAVAFPDRILQFSEECIRSD